MRRDRPKSLAEAVHLASALRQAQLRQTWSHSTASLAWRLWEVEREWEHDTRLPRHDERPLERRRLRLAQRVDGGEGQSVLLDRHKPSRARKHRHGRRGRLGDEERGHGRFVCQERA